jgi:hypothetical protein
MGGGSSLSNVPLKSTAIMVDISYVDATSQFARGNVDLIPTFSAQ